MLFMICAINYFLIASQECFDNQKQRLDQFQKQYIMITTKKIIKPTRNQGIKEIFKIAENFEYL